MVEEKTTIELKVDLWAALDKRKGGDESFDDYIRRLVDNTNMPMGTLQNTAEAPRVETGAVERAADPPKDAACAHFDPIDGMCENAIEYSQEYRPSYDDEFDKWYWCEKHAPDEATELD